MILSWNRLYKFNVNSPSVVCVWDDDYPILKDPHPIMEWLDFYPSDSYDCQWKNYGKKLYLTVSFFDLSLATMFRLKWDGNTNVT